MTKHERVVAAIRDELDPHAFYAEPSVWDQLGAILSREYGGERNAALEDAARKCEEYVGVERIAASIRAMKGEE